MEHLKENKEKRNVYIDNQPKEKALKTYMEALEDIKQVEEILTSECLGRITSQAVYANISSPFYHSSAMDGICVKAEVTFGASEKEPKILVKDKDFKYINTGYPIPADCDAVIMIEDVIPVSEDKIKIMASAYPWQHIRTVGEDMAKGEMIIPSKHKITGIDLGALYGGGVEKVSVYKKVSVGVIPTGNEVTRDIANLQVGDIIDSNSFMFKGLIEESGNIAKLYDPIYDDPEIIESTILRAVAENDLVIINAGSSAGSKDYTADIIRKLGQVVVHGIAIKPGKPTILGIVNNKRVIGIPGYPVSAYFSFRSFVEPVINHTLGLKAKVDKVQATLAKSIVSSLKHEEYVRVTLGLVNDRLIATALQRGAGNTTSLVRADGVLTIPREIEGINAGDLVEVHLLKDLTSIKERAVLIGSHDIVIDVIGDMMPITSAHVGSLNGILAKRKEECLLAPIHLLDEKTGIYNDSYVDKYFKNRRMAIIHGVKRMQGIMVKKGNPLDIKGFQDFTRDDVMIVNRQRGSGTRQLIDYQLKEQKIDSDLIEGYDREMTTHMSVAVAVESGAAHAGVGVFSAAECTQLDFIPIGYENYEFLVEEKDLGDDRVQEFIKVLQSEEFKERVSALGGYILDECGSIRIVGESND